jgi:hypothetical protein
MGMHRPLRIVVAALSSLALVAGVIGVAAATRGGAGRPPLVLLSNGKLTADAALAPIGNPVAYRYRLAGPPPDLGSDAPVGRLVVPAADAARVGAMARTLGLHGVPTETHPGWRVTDGAAQLTLVPAPGGWDVAYAYDAGNTAAGSTPGSAGSALGSSGSGSSGSGSSGSGNAGDVAPAPPTVVAPPTPATVVAPPKPGPASTTLEIPARHLPAPSRAEELARALLVKLGVADDSWSATTSESARDSVTCSAPPCAEPLVLLMSRMVVLRPTFDSIGVDGLSWQIEIGDNGKIYSVSGLWATSHTIARTHCDRSRRSSPTSPRESATATARDPWERARCLRARRPSP